jgi:geranylgeranyl diphosphate synthase type II
MDEKLFSARMAEYKSAVDKYLDACLEETQCASYHKLTDSMHYSLTAGGKRLRAILVLEFCRICGGDVEKALPVACGVEMLHTYSLIHDDLPVMDNDDLRRGKPSNHKVFGECTATLAGDALQALAFETVLKADLPALRVLKCAQVLANAAGHEGICGGQQLDLEWEGKILSAPELEEIYLRKTSALIRAACLMGVAAAGGTKKQEEAAASYADNFGFAFQLRDDMLDVIGDEKTFGKPIGSDKEEGKITYVDVDGLEGCARAVEACTRKAKDAVAQWPDHDFLFALADQLVDRNK